MRNAVTHVLNHACFKLGFTVTNRHFPLIQHRKEKPQSAPNDWPEESCDSRRTFPLSIPSCPDRLNSTLGLQPLWRMPSGTLLPARLWPTCIPAEGCRKWTGNIPKITQKQFLRSWPVITHQEAWEAVCRQQGVGIPGYWQAGGSDVPGFPLPSIYPTKMFSLDLALTHNHPQHTSYLSGPVISKKELSIDSLELTSFSEDRTVKDDTEGLWGK